MVCRNTSGARSRLAIASLCFWASLAWAEAEQDLSLALPEDLRGSFLQATADGQHLEAADVVKRSIWLLLQDEDGDRMVYGRLLTLLGDAQQQAGDFSTAIENYDLAIEVFEEERDRLSAALVAPLLGKSRSLMGARRYPEAIRNYRRTLHVHQVNNGLFGVRAANMIVELSEAYFLDGDFDAANAMQESSVALVERVHNGDNLERLPSLYNRAEMLTRTASYETSLKAYRRIIAMIEHVEGPESLHLIPAFNATASLLVSHYILDGAEGTDRARRYLRRAVAIAERNDAAGPDVRADTHITLGDFLNTQTQDVKAYCRSYLRGWDLLNGDPDFHGRRDQLFALPVLLNPVPEDTPYTMLSLLQNSTEPDTIKNGFIQVHYDVDDGGRPRNVRIVESVPEGLYDYVVRNHVRDFRFRPRIEDGEVKSSPNQEYTIRFSYAQEDLSDDVWQNSDSDPETNVSE